MVIFCLYLCLILLFLGINLINKSSINKIARRVEESSDKVTYKRLKENILQYLKDNKINTVHVGQAKTYFFDCINNILRIKDKKDYSEYDMFVSYHEAGHAIDFNTKYRTLYFITVKMRIIFYISWMIVLSINLITVIEVIQLNIYILIMNIVEIIMGLVILLLTIVIECSASIKAINDFEFSNNSRRKELEKLAKLSVYDQVIVWLLFILPLLFLLYLMILMI